MLIPSFQPGGTLRKNQTEVQEDSWRQDLSGDIAPVHGLIECIQFSRVVEAG